MKRWIALLLALSMLLSFAACGKKPSNTQDVETSQETAQIGASSEEQEADRKDKELIAEMLGDGDYTLEELDTMTDEELDKIVQQLVSKLDEEEIVQLGNSETPSVDINEDYYTEDGGMTIPFDQAYPELVESGSVPFSNESLLIKLRSDKLTDGLKLAGVVALEETVPMEGCSWYTARLLEGTDAYKALAAVRELDEVILAELNYVIATAVVEETDESGNEVLEQWHLNRCGIPNAAQEQEYAGGASNVIVAVIDTGVDYDHEDLAKNIWKNTSEIPDNGIDDDNNGYVDDYYGVDVVSGWGNGDDTNGHGTHVAGIIAARNNDFGVVGIAYNVQIMPVKAASHSGYFLQGDIAKAVLYAHDNGAEVINMSFGGTACSIAVQDALAMAYTRCVLVASAGNDGMPNEMTDNYLPLPNYPAALTYVLGVMSVSQSGVESVFSNWDAIAFNGSEYELYAPGEAIVSTLPNNTYGALSGTSMAAPVVAACAAILRSEFADRDKYPTKFIYGQLASTSEDTAICCNPKMHTVQGLPHNLPQIVNLYAALTVMPKPEVGLNDYYLFDSPKYSEKNNGDGVIDAGETIALGLTLRNRWGMSENTQVTIDTLSMVGMEDPYITIHNPTVNYGSVGTYSTKDCGKIYTDELFTDWEDPFLITISEDCPNDYIFLLNVTVTCENALDEKDDSVYASKSKVMEFVRSGYILPTVIDEDMVLTKNNLYIIPNATIINEGVTVRVEAGTHIQFWGDDASDPYADSYIAYLLVNGNFLVEGTKEEPVYIYPSQLMDRYGVEIGSSERGYISLKYADITNFFYEDNHTGTGNHIDVADHCTFRSNYSQYFNYRYISEGVVEDTSSWSGSIGNINAKDCVFYKLAMGYGPSLSGNFERCMFAQCGIEHYGQQYKDCVFLGNAMVDQTNPDHYYNSSMSAQALKLPSASDIADHGFQVFYWPEKGTTYVCWYSSGEERRTKAYAEFLKEAFGGDFVKIETAEEREWLRGRYGSFNAGIYWDMLQGQYVWADGTPLDLELFPNAATFMGDEFFRLRIGSEGLSYSWEYYAMYEIPGEILPEDIKFAEYAVDLDLETTYQILPQNAPAQLPTSSFLYESTDEAVLTISDTGLVTPVAKGTADVWVWSMDRAVRNRITFTIKDYVPLEALAFPQSDVKLEVGESKAIRCILTPANTTRNNVTYTVADENVAAVENGVLVAKNKGTTTVTATCEGISASMTVTVFVKAVSWNLENYCLSGTMESLYTSLPKDELVVYPENADLDLEWRSSDESIFSVEDGKLIMKRAGNASLYVKDRLSGLESSWEFTVKSSAPVIQKDVLAAQLSQGELAMPEVILGEGAPAEPQWKILDPNVATLENGKIVLQGVGITTLRATDPRTGLFDDITIYIMEGPLPRVKEIYGYEHRYVALMEDGRAYYWCADTYTKAAPKLLAENVLDVSYWESYFVLLTDKEITRYYIYSNGNIDSVYILPDGVEAIDVSGYYYCDEWNNRYGSMHILTKSGEVYAIGDNNYGVLGTGDGETLTELTRVTFPEPVVQIERYGNMAYFLTKSGCLYVAGGNALKMNTPVMIGRNVTWLDDGGVYYTTGDSLVYFGEESTAPVVLGLDCSTYTVLSMYKNEKYRGIATKDGKLYTIYAYGGSGANNLSWNVTPIMTGLTSAKDAYYGNNYYYAVTEDGLLFGCGTGETYYNGSWDNASNAFMGMTSERNIGTDRGLFLPVVRPEESLCVLQTNLQTEQEISALTEETLQLTFNKQLLQAKITLHENGTPMIMYQSIQDNLLVLTPSVGFAEGVTYKVVVATATMGFAGVVPAEEIVIEFTYQAPESEETEPEEPKPEETNPEETNPEEKEPEEILPQEEVVYETIVDESVIRYWTAERLVEELDAYIQETQWNPKFIGNAILNPISTDFEVSHWLRIQAPTVSAGEMREIPLGGNWWGSVDERAIGLQMIDYTDFVTYGKLNYAPYLTSAPENTFPFVTSVTLLNKDNEAVSTVGNEKVTFRVTFNRDMDTSVPLSVRFGSAYPYGDYEIKGEYVNARTWEGEYTLTTLIENGNQFFSIQNGCSATDDLALQWDLARFGFEIDTTAAQALIMQGVAENEGIRLTWTQDDFDTLMGYNVYRSNAADGYYTRMNDTTVPADTKEFFDTDVEPGVVYYYNFTVVKTDLTESEPSGKIIIMSKDTMAPSVYHSGVGIATAGKNLVISATISDNLNITYANLYYRTVGQTQWTTVRMNGLNSKFSAIVPAVDITLDGLEYYIEAFDGVSSTATKLYTVMVQESVESSEMGDVDNNGIINNKDALMTLQAIHHKYNLSASEFARADLDGNGILEAWEVLRILQYISGTIGTLDMRK